jgi:D-alanyl-D-alanine carboxypeptidase
VPSRSRPRRRLHLRPPSSPKPPPPPPPAASRPDEADRAGIAQLFAEASALPPIEVASVRRVALLPAAGLPRPLPAESEAPVPPSASETPAPVGRAGAFAARRMSVDTPPLQTETSALAPGRPPSTLDAQARANATDEAPMPAMALASQGATPVPPTPAALRPAAAPAGDFQLQIGAFGSEGEATRALSATRSRTGDLLRGANEAALLVQKDNRKFYRARFTGFDAVRAQNTCAELKRQKIDCFVMRAE